MGSPRLLAHVIALCLAIGSASAQTAPETVPTGRGPASTPDGAAAAAAPAPASVPPAAPATTPAAPLAAKQADPKSAEQDKADAKIAELKKAELKKAEEKKAELKKAEEKKAEAKKTLAKMAEAKLAAAQAPVPPLLPVTKAAPAAPPLNLGPAPATALGPALGPAAAAAAAASVDPAQAASPASDARHIFDDSRPRLLQLRVLLRGSGSPDSSGSGFVVDASGLAVTNYHVVASAVLEPERYRLGWQSAAGAQGEASILAVDLRNDLAVIQLGQQQTSVFELRGAQPALANGDKLYSMGNPLDIGFTVSEGSYNGRVERGIYDLLHFTGALNPGMSGGPAVTADGKVAGVNVSQMRGGQLVNMLVPVAAVHPLLASARAGAKVDREALRKQLLAHQAHLVARLTKETWATRRIGRFELPVMPTGLTRCAGARSPEHETVYRHETLECRLGTHLSLGDGLSVGDVAYALRVVRTESMSELRLAQWVANVGGERGEMTGGSTRPGALMSPGRCQTRFVDIRDTYYRLRLCAASYRTWSGLYDVLITMNTLPRDGQVLIGRMLFDGVTWDNAMLLTRRYLESIRWVP